MFKYQVDSTLSVSFFCVCPGIGMPKIETPVSRIYAKEVEEMVRPDLWAAPLCMCCCCTNCCRILKKHINWYPRISILQYKPVYRDDTSILCYSMLRYFNMFFDISELKYKQQTIVL